MKEGAQKVRDNITDISLLIRIRFAKFWTGHKLQSYASEEIAKQVS